MVTTKVTQEVNGQRDGSVQMLLSRTGGPSVISGVCVKGESELTPQIVL